jgi:hypothetical protein
MAEPDKWRLSRAGLLGALIFGLTSPLGWKPAEGIAYNAGYTTGGLLVGFGLFAAIAALRNRLVGAKG